MGVAHLFTHSTAENVDVRSTLPDRFDDLRQAPVKRIVFEHAKLPNGVSHFPNRVLQGCVVPAAGYPSLKSMKDLTPELAGGFTIFGFEARLPGLLITTRPYGSLQEGCRLLSQILDTSEGYPIVHVDYPFTHPARVCGVWSKDIHVVVEPNPGRPTRFRLTAPPENLDVHCSRVGEIVSDMRKRGITVQPTPASDAAALGKVLKDLVWTKRQARGAVLESLYPEQTLVEVMLAEETYTLPNGEVTYRFKPQTEWRLLAFVRPAPSAKKISTPKKPDEPTAGRTVMCLNTENGLLGCTGKIVSYQGQTVTVQLSASTRTPENRWRVQLDKLKLVRRELGNDPWLRLPVLARKAEISQRALHSLFRSVPVRGSKGLREDIGMNLIATLKTTGEALCLPGYSAAVYPNDRYGRDHSSSNVEYLFSTLTLDLINDYRKAWPQVFEFIDNKTSQDATRMTAKALFPRSLDPDWKLGQLSAWCSKQPFRRLRLVTAGYRCIGPPGVRVLESSLVEDLKCRPHNKRSETVEVTVSTEDAIVPEIDERLPSEIVFYNNQSMPDLLVGQRVVYARWKGVATFGAVGTIIGTYWSQEKSLIEEVLLDEPTLDASDLNGRCSEFRGVLVPVEHLIPIPPYLTPGGLGSCEAYLSSLQPIHPRRVQQGRRMGPAGPPNVKHESTDDDAGLRILRAVGASRRIPAYPTKTAQEEGASSKRKALAANTPPHRRVAPTRDSNDVSNGARLDSDLLYILQGGQRHSNHPGRNEATLVAAAAPPGGGRGEAAVEPSGGVEGRRILSLITKATPPQQASNPEVDSATEALRAMLLQNRSRLTPPRDSEAIFRDASLDTRRSQPINILSQLAASFKPTQTSDRWQQQAPTMAPSAACDPGKKLLEAINRVSRQTAPSVSPPASSPLTQTPPPAATSSPYPLTAAVLDRLNQLAVNPVSEVPPSKPDMSHASRQILSLLKQSHPEVAPSILSQLLPPQSSSVTVPPAASQVAFPVVPGVLSQSFGGGANGLARLQAQAAGLVPAANEERERLRAAMRSLQIQRQNEQR